MGKHKPGNVKEDDSRSSSSIHKTKRKHRKRNSSSSDCSKSCSDGDSSDHERSRDRSSKKERRSTSADRKKLRKDKKRQKKKKKLEKKLKKEKKRLRKMMVDKPKEIEVPVVVHPEKVSLALSDSEDITERLLTHRAKAMAPMTKEEWDKRQSVVRRVYDEETGRNRLIKGDGEVIEEIVSRDRHVAINRRATQGDGNFFQASLATKLRK